MIGFPESVDDEVDSASFWRRLVTCCIAALCDQRKTLILIADRMLGAGFAQAELKISKIRQMHQDWWVLIAGGASPAFDIIDGAALDLRGSEHTVLDAESSVATHYRKKRLDEASAFNDPNRGLEVRLLVAGFDSAGVGHIFTVENPGVCQRKDIPGFAAIGSGSFGAYYMLLWREIDIQMKASDVLYFAFEAKIFGESAPGVGYETDMYIFRKGFKPMKVSKRSEEKMERIWRKLEPGLLKPEQHRVLQKLAEIKSLRRR